MLEGLDRCRCGAVAATETSAARHLLRDQVHRAVEPHGEDFLDIGQVGVCAVMQHERSVAPDAGSDRLARLGMQADFARKRQQLQGLFEGEAVGRPALGQRRALRFGSVAQLYIWAEPSRLQGNLEAAFGIGAEDAVAGPGFGRAAGCRIGKLHRVAALGIVRAADEGAELAQLQRELAFAAVRAATRVGAVGLGREDMVGQHLVEGIEHLGDAEVLDLLDMRLEILPEVAQHVLPGELAIRDQVKLLLEAGGEAVLDVAVEEALEEGGDDAAAILGHEGALLEADVVAVLQHAHGGGIGGGSADAELFHLLDQARFGVARRRLREVLLDQRLLEARTITDREGRQLAAVDIVLGIVGPLFLGLHAVEREEAGEGDHRTDGAQRDVAARGEDRDVGGGALDFGRAHLAGQRALPDQLIEPVPVRVAAQGIGLAEHVGGADGLVGLLRVLGLGLVDAGLLGDVLRAEFLDDGAAGLLDRLGRHLHAVGTHVGDDAVLVEPLRDLHGAAGREAEARRGVLLQARGGERRIGIAFGRLLVDGGDREGACLDGGTQRLGIGGGADIELVRLLAVDGVEAGLERLALLVEAGADGPVFLRLELLDLAFAIRDDAQRHRLHAAGRAGARQLAPQHGREGEADEVIERTAGEVGLDQRLVDVARVLHRLGDRRLGDGVEDDAADRLVLDQLFLPQHVEHVPADRLAFAIRVGGEDQFVSVLEGIADVAQPLARGRVDLPAHGEVLVRQHRAILGRQVADMAKARQDLIVLAKIAVDCLGLGRTFNDDELHWFMLSGVASKRGATW